MSVQLVLPVIAMFPLWEAMKNVSLWSATARLRLLADRLAVRVGRRHRDRVVAYVAVGRSAGDDAGMGIDAEARLAVRPRRSAYRRRQER